MIPALRRVLFTKPQFSLAWQAGVVESSGGTTINYSSLAFGAVDPNRSLIVVIAARMATVNAASSVVIDGLPATLVAVGGGSTIQQGGTNGSNISIWQQTLPSGNTVGTVSVTWGAATQRSGLSVYRLISANPNPVDANVVTSASGAVTQSIIVPPGGKGIAGLWAGGAVAANVWTNATSDYTAIANSSSRFDTGVVTGVGTVSVTGTGNVNAVLSLASWRP